jgi:hypothetical protein
MQPRINLRLLLVVLLALCAASDVLGAQLTPLLQEGELGAGLKGVSLPPTLRKDLVSGLTNRIVVRMSLLDERQPAAQRLVGIAIKYDLWEETFGVKVAIDDVPVSATTYRSVDEVIAMLTDLNLPHLFRAESGAAAGSGVSAGASAGAGAAKEIALSAEILFDPIEKARMDEIRKWVAENDRPSPPDANSLSSELPAPRSPSARLFNKIFEQYASGASVAVTWKQTVTSKPFKLEDLRHGP